MSIIIENKGLSLEVGCPNKKFPQAAGLYKNYIICIKMYIELFIYL